MPSHNPLPSASPQELKSIKICICNRTTEPYLLLVIRLAFLRLLSMVCNALTPLHMSKLEHMLSRTGNRLLLFIYLFIYLFAL